MFIADDEIRTIKNVVSCQVLQLQYVEFVCLVAEFTIWTVLYL